MEKKKTFDVIKHKGAMAVPSLFTIGNLACGFFSILSSFGGNFYRAGWLIFLGMVLDAFDGRVARMLHAESEFGVEMDSLADIISFCAAPAFLIYNMTLKDYGGIGTCIAFIFLLCGALRLAKFNAMAHAGTGSKKHFSGLPTPAAAAIIAAFAVSYMVFLDLGKGQNIPFLNMILPYIYNFMALIVIALSVLMVSNIPYAAFKDKKERKKRGVGFIIFIALLVFFTFKYPQNVIFIVFSLYVFMGIFALLFKAFKNLKD
ncbi:CDP-diacylglycerol/serine O-phosphatidyltransferase [Elusimicrobium minutum Pei191]|uniref:CDP-diacylglycerol--serine O-phosphatidyltransferase n=1 Tax=Elusimicrobium minutum (strain Pei191) TaxID=445932 RepID=B2KAY7_ELUMP|nr:CDP-diacylglycerol--serine O-phosphatidyltransferase [Elusimicrobium minutum]ACC97683.1 CDP-diacylglycerol/serine O-phosphatidyltransferase [Elusimicrobium minutum Pei191]